MNKNSSDLVVCQFSCQRYRSLAGTKGWQCLDCLGFSSPDTGEYIYGLITAFSV